MKTSEIGLAGESRRASVSGALAVALLGAACGVFGATEEDPAPEAPPDSQSSKNAEPPAPPLDGKPIEGVYVSSSKGNDSNDGSVDHPVATLKKGFALGKERDVRVLVCAETFTETLTILDGVSAYGNFDCSVTPWRLGTERARIEAPSIPAATAEGITKPTRIESFAIVAHDGTVDEPSSIGLRVKSSKNLVIAKSAITSGSGRDGKDGAGNAANDELNGSLINGEPSKPQFVCTTSFCDEGAVAATFVQGGTGGTSRCSNGAAGSPGGLGGQGRWFFATDSLTPSGFWSATGRPFPNSPHPTISSGGVGGSPGADGTNGRPGADGKDGANGVWSLGPDGFVPGDGAVGEDGASGGGGGGAGAALYYFCSGFTTCAVSRTHYFSSATGGGGAAGGCAGLHAQAGTGGGASIAALVSDSTIAVDESTLSSGKGGRAGKGHVGGLGTAGGAGGPPSFGAGRGGYGGRGGASGVSGHGAPGPSIVLAYRGARPVTTSTELLVAAPGAGQPELTKQITPLLVRKVPAINGVAALERTF